MHTLIRVTLFVFLLPLAAVPRASAGGAPDWLIRAASAGPTASELKAGAVVLLDEEVIQIDASGVVRTTRRYAVRVQARDGRDAARVAQVYLTDSERVQAMRAWLLRPRGDAVEYGKDRVADVALVNDDVYNEARVRSVGAGTDAEPGTVFGAEISTEGRQPFGQFEWQVQDEWPVRLARRSLAMPPGWEASSATFNHDTVRPEVSGTSYVWEVRDLPAMADEPSAPGPAALAARIAVTCVPPASASFWPSVADWPRVSRWLAGLSDPQAEPDAAVSAKAREVTAAATTDLARIRAVTAFVQRLRYVSIQTGIARGGGYRPHPAGEVLSRGYGDCKNKATLMRAMLAALGIRTRLVSIYAGDRNHVREEWPSPEQFNHVIVAVTLTEPWSPPAVVERSAFGRLLLVDPTDEDGTVGHLPAVEQGSLALIVAREGGTLLRVPSGGPESNAVTRSTDASLAPDGALTASVRERHVGEAGDTARGLLRALSPKDYRERLIASLTRAFGAVSLNRLDTRDNHDDGTVEVDLDLVAPAYVRPLRQKLTLLRLPAYGDGILPPVTSPTRQLPLLVEATEVTERMSLTLPATLAVDELPSAVEIGGPYGRFTLTWRQDGARVVMDRCLRLERSEVPPSDYGALRRFVEGVRAAQEAVLVLTTHGASDPPAPRGLR